MDLDALELEEDGFALTPPASQPQPGQRNPLVEARVEQEQGQQQQRPAENNGANKRRSMATTPANDFAAVLPSPTSASLLEPLAKRPNAAKAATTTAATAAATTATRTRPRQQQRAPPPLFAGAVGAGGAENGEPASFPARPPRAPSPPRFEGEGSDDAGEGEGDDDEEEDAIPGPAGALREALRRGLVLEDGSEAAAAAAAAAAGRAALGRRGAAPRALALAAAPSLALVPALRDPRFDEGSAWDAAARAHGGWRDRAPAAVDGRGGGTALACVSGAVASAGAAGERSPRLALLVETLRPTVTAASLGGGSALSSDRRRGQQQAPAGSGAAALLRDPTGAVAAAVCSSLLPLLPSSSSSSSSSSSFPALRAGDAILIDGAPILRPGWGRAGPLPTAEAAAAAPPVLVLTPENVLGIWSKGSGRGGGENGNRAPPAAPTRQRWAALPPCPPPLPRQEVGAGTGEHEGAPRAAPLPPSQPQQPPREREQQREPQPPAAAPPPPSASAPPATHNAIENLMEGLDDLDDEEGALVACGLLTQEK